MRGSNLARHHAVVFILLLPFLVVSMTNCSHAKSETRSAARDIHSWGNPSEARVRHVNLDLEVVFEQRTIRGTAVLTIEQTGLAKQLVLDSRALQIDETEVSPDGAKYREANSPWAKPIRFSAPRFASISRPIRSSSASATPQVPAPRAPCSGWLRSKQRASSTRSSIRNRRQSTPEAGSRCRTRPVFALRGKPASKFPRA